jgi:radical SAM-linked protein
MVRQRVRIRFAKHGDLRLIGHRDLMRTWERLFRRVGLVLCMTEGFHPKPKMMFPSALAVGIEGLAEVLEIELPEEHDPDGLATRLRTQAPPGLVVLGVEALAGGKTKLRGMSFALEVPAQRRPKVAQRIERLAAQNTGDAPGECDSAPLDFRLIVELALGDDGTLRFRLRVNGDASIRPRDVLAALDLGDLEAQGVVLRRTAVELTT